MKRLLAWLGSKLPADPNLDRYDDPLCVLCPLPALQDGLCGEHGGLPWFDWPGEKQARLSAEIKGKP